MNNISKIDNRLDALETFGWEGSRRVDTFEGILRDAASELLEYYADEFGTDADRLKQIINEVAAQVKN